MNQTIIGMTLTVLVGAIAPYSIGKARTFPDRPIRFIISFEPFGHSVESMRCAFVMVREQQEENGAGISGADFAAAAARGAKNHSCYLGFVPGRLAISLMTWSVMSIRWLM